MRTTLTRLFTVALLMMVSLGAKADVKVLFGEKGTELQPDKGGTITLAQKELTGGTIIISQEEQKDGTTKVTFAVTPDKNYKLAENGLEVYAVIPTDISPTRGLEVSTALTLKSEDFKDEASKRTYTTTIDSKLALWVKSADFQPQKRDGAKGTKVPDGVYYIKNSNDNGNKWYLWPAITVTKNGDNFTYAYNYLTTHDGQTADAVTNNNNVSYPAHDNTYSHWVVKNVEGGYIQLINPKLNKYVVIRNKKYGDRDVWLKDVSDVGSIDYTYFILNGDNSSYKISPKAGLNSVDNTSGYSFNSASGNDRTWLTWSKTDNKPQNGEGREGLIQLYSGGTPTWSFNSDLLPAPTINYDSENNNFTISYNQIPVGFDILYTTNNSDPTIGGSNTTIVSAPASGSTDAIDVTGSYNVKAVIARYGVILTETASQFVGTPDAPTITPPSDCNNLVTMAAGGAPIYYTLDGSTPDNTNTSTLYTEPFVQNTAATIKAIAYVDGAYSDVTTYSYTPTYSVKPTITINGYDVTITGEGTIYYTLDGNDPTTGSSVYSTPISLSSANDAVTIKAVAKDGDKELSCVAEQTFVPATPGYYAIHQDGKGYLRVNSANVTLTNDGTFRYGDLFDNNGNSIWYVTPSGYLQNGYFYLNVINGRTLCLSVEPETRWQTEKIAGDAHGKMHLKTGGLYLCNDNTTITLSASPSAYYNACPITITEKSWSGPSASDLTLQSPQQVTYLRAYYTQKMDYEFYNDAGTKVSENGKDRRVYAKLYYESGGSNKGNNWDINTTSGVIYNKLTSNVTITATYRIEPADPIAFGLHSTPGTKSIKYTLQPKSITPVAEMNYLLFSIKAGNDYRYPYDDNIAEGGDVKPDGKGGTGASSVLTDPDTPNLQISWKLTVDEEGFYTFQNASTNKYLYYDETPHASSDYGALKLGSSPSDNRYKFRLYKTSNTDYEVCYQIIPYSRQFAVYNNNGVATGFYASLNNNNYKTQTPKVISLYKADDNSQWCIYKYEAEYRIKKDFSIKVETSATANATGAYLFSSEGWYAKCIKESPKTGNGQNGLVINGTYKNENNINYQWTVTGIGDYTSISDGNNTAGINSDGTWTITTTGNDNNKKLTINVTALPASTVSGIVKLRLSGGESPNVVTSVNADEKTVAFTILGDGTLTLTEISSLAEIVSISGAYKLTQDVTYSSSNKPTVSTFSGILDCDGHTITDLNAPLFETLTNGTVRNVNLSDVSISGNSGPTGAIAGTADGGSRIYNIGILDGSVGSSDGVCGGLVGLLDGSARVINCFSYANITGGTDVGGIVGYNSFASKAGEIRTMVMNCMFYGDITAGTNVSPVFGGNNISNLKDDSDRAKDGLNTFNYYAYDKATTYNARTENATKKYNSALAVEDKYLNRFEFYRLLLNSNKKLAAFYATGSPDNADQKMMKWVLETADRSISGRDPYPYPILKAQGYYPSIINYDAEHAPDSASVGRNKGGKLGKTLSVTISGVGSNAPSGATITTGSLNLQRTDKDFDRFNYNYDKVQLPYYNDVGTGNYTGNRVVTGWKITAIDAISGDPYTADNYPTTGVKDFPDHNYADRRSSNKDLYSISGRVFSQGAYFDVPYGVTSITIEPYWGKACYIADEYYDVVYKNDYSGKQGVTQTGTQVTVGTTKFYGQDVQKSIEPALNYIANSLDGLGPTVYDNALVLVGNLHLDVVPLNGDRPFTMMSVDADKDNEPDYSLIYHHKSRSNITPIRFDFLAVPGTAQAQKPNGASLVCNFTIFKTRGWFEVTNTAFMYSSQIEYENGDLGNNVTKIDAPLILLGGIFDQFVSTQSSKVNGKTIYIHVGSNVWINSFGLGTHSDGSQSTPHVPVSVTGGEYEGFYLTGTYKADATVRTDNAECYISGGYFHEAAGASLEQIDGDVHWQIYNADIDEFFGGGINDDKPITGDIEVDIFNSYVTTYCGGPKFGNMQPDKTVTTNAEGCTFGKFFGAGYGGTSLAKKKYYDLATYNWNTLQGYYTGERGKFYDGKTTGCSQISGKDYGKKGPGVSTDFEYEYFVWTSGEIGARFYVDFAAFSLAKCNDVESKLKNCVIENNFYGGGSLGKVVGTVTSELDGCTVKGNVFGAGYSASLPTLKVRDAGFTQSPNYNSSSGMFESGIFSGTTDFTWRNISDAQEDETTLELVNNTIKNGTSGSNLTKHFVYTDVNLSKSNLGSVEGSVILTIKGNSVIGTAGDANTGNVYGGGEMSYVVTNTNITNQKVIVNLEGNTEVRGNVYGGGDEGEVQCSTEVNIRQ